MTNRTNISNWIDSNARFAPGKTALIFEGQTISYQQLATEIARVAYLLQKALGVKEGDRVGILSFNRVEYLTLLFACARIGAILNPLNWRLAVPELLYIVENAELSVLFLEQELNAITDALAENYRLVK